MGHPLIFWLSNIICISSSLPTTFNKAFDLRAYWNMCTKLIGLLGSFKCVFLWTRKFEEERETNKKQIAVYLSRSGEGNRWRYEATTGMLAIKKCAFSDSLRVKFTRKNILWKSALTIFTQPLSLWKKKSQVPELFIEYLSFSRELHSKRKSGWQWNMNKQLIKISHTKLWMKSMKRALRLHLNLKV